MLSLAAVDAPVVRLVRLATTIAVAAVAAVPVLAVVVLAVVVAADRGRTKVRRKLLKINQAVPLRDGLIDFGIWI